MSERQEGCRSIRVHFAMEKGNGIRRTFERLFWRISDSTPYCFVETTDEADLVIFERLSMINGNFSESKTYVLLNTYRYSGLNLPSNVTDVTSSCDVLGTLSELIRTVWIKLDPL